MEMRCERNWAWGDMRVNTLQSVPRIIGAQGKYCWIPMFKTL